MPEDDSSIGALLSSFDSSAASRSSRFDDAKIHLSIDLVSAARWHLAFLKSLSGSFIHRSAAIVESIRRYTELWMPLINDLSMNSVKTPMILPPLDVWFVWHCHCLKPSRYREFCSSRFARLVERPAIFDEGNEEFASDLCREIWTARYPSDPYDLEEHDYHDQDDRDDDSIASRGEIFSAICKFRDLCSMFLDPFVGETVYLVSARQKYKNFLHLCRKYADRDFRLVPTSDVLLMWLTHQSFPGIYARDMQEFLGTIDLESRAVGFWEKPGDGEVERTMKIWEQAFDEAYERAGSCFDLTGSPLREFFYWDSSGSDSESNRKYRTLQPRSLTEVCVFLKANLEGERKDDGKMFFRLRTIRCSREMKLEKPVSSSSSSSWEKSWNLCCEFGTRGLILELCRNGGSCFGTNKSIKSLVFTWNELLRASSLALRKNLGDQIKAMISITPPIQAPFLLKFVPDRVTDDKGSMISDEILRMNQYHPQAGRWISRTVLDCYGRECFVVRLRVGEGIWRRGAETPRLVKRGERIIEVREGSWSYLASSIGIAPQKIVGTAELKEEAMAEKTATWALSTGGLLSIRWQNDLEIELNDQNSLQQIRIEAGKKLQYNLEEEARISGDDEFLTFIRFSEENPTGRATALLNWRVLAVEFLPEEDAVFVLLVSMAIVLAVTEMKMEDVGQLLIRRRVKEATAGTEDWGSVMLRGGSSSWSSRPWFWNPREVFSSAAMENAAHPLYRYPPADGKEELYRQGIGLSGERNHRGQ